MRGLRLRSCRGRDLNRDEKLCSLDGTESREDRERQYKRDMAALTPEQQDALGDFEQFLQLKPKHKRNPLWGKKKKPSQSRGDRR